MFVFVDFAGHTTQTPVTGNLVDRLGINGEIAQWGPILCELGGGSTSQVVVVGGPQEKDAFPDKVRDVTLPRYTFER